MHIIGMLIVGLIAGALARLILPGRDPMGILMTVVLGEPGEPFSDAAALLSWGFDRFERQAVVSPGRSFGRVEIGGSQVDVVAIQWQILLRVAGCEWIGGWAFLQRLFDHVTFGAHDLLFAIHDRAIRFPDLQRLLGWKTHAHMFDDPQAGFMDLPDFFDC